LKVLGLAFWIDEYNSGTLPSKRQHQRNDNSSFLSAAGRGLGLTSTGSA
jgi:hypothetical protein